MRGLRADVLEQDEVELQARNLDSLNEGDDQVRKELENSKTSHFPGSVSAGLRHLRDGVLCFGWHKRTVLAKPNVTDNVLA